MRSIGLRNEALHTACCIWSRPDRPKGPALEEWSPHHPILTHLVREVPRVGDKLSLELPRHDDPREGEWERPVVVVHGVVRGVEYRDALDAHMIYLNRQGRVGVRWSDLEEQLGEKMAGYHPDLGRVEGTLDYLLPGAELAVLHVPALREMYHEKLRSQGQPVPDANEGPRVPVAWSAVWRVDNVKTKAKRRTTVKEAKTAGRSQRGK